MSWGSGIPIACGGRPGENPGGMPAIGGGDPDGANGGGMPGGDPDGENGGGMPAVWGDVPGGENGGMPAIGGGGGIPDGGGGSPDGECSMPDIVEDDPAGWGRPGIVGAKQPSLGRGDPLRVHRVIMIEGHRGAPPHIRMTARTSG